MFNFKYVVIISICFVAIYFLYTLNRVYNQSKEINCITYYTSLGYIGNGCDKFIKNFVDGVESDD